MRKGRRGRGRGRGRRRAAVGGRRLLDLLAYWTSSYSVVFGRIRISVCGGWFTSMMMMMMMIILSLLAGSESASAVDSLYRVHVKSRLPRRHDLGQNRLNTSAFRQTQEDDYRR